MKNTMLTASTTFAVIVRPNQAMNTGASAIRGTLLIGVMNGPTIASRVGLSPRIRPATVPVTEPITKATAMAVPVDFSDARWRSEGRYSHSDVQMPLG
jgi:hypothetical protein